MLGLENHVICTLVFMDGSSGEQTVWPLRIQSDVPPLLIVRCPSINIYKV